MPGGNQIEVGTVRRMLVVDNLTRTQIVQYAGASGDYNPIHTDEIYARDVAGYPTVFAHGMLTMAVTGRLLTDWFGPDGLKRFGVRFRRQVWPGDSLTASATVVEINPGEHGDVLELVISTVNQDGVEVLSGQASVLARS